MSGLMIMALSHSFWLGITLFQFSLLSFCASTAVGSWLI